MVPSFFDRHQSFKDALGIFVFVICVLIGTVFINAFIFRSFNVEGPSMQDTLFTGDRLLVNRTVVTWAQLQNKSYIPERGQVIVFKNPQYVPGLAEEYIVKRVVAFAGERVVLKDGKFTVYDNKNLNGIDPDTFNDGKPTAPIEGEVDTIVPEGTVFVVGDNRVDGYSKDSRNGLGTIPYYDIIGPVSLRIFPFDQIRIF
ncbi:MAG TPA: signal peptidase I [Candidatus Saccharibacteria bacterium]|nr:signal peptidase I [Candidatus Saccharibacteria bacterium]HRK94322.1 signal peptidase I [Candidatus Saccharibacteria bacterium]